MEALILGKNFATLAIVDAFDSFIWTDRYNEPGDFEIYMPIAKAPIDYIKRENYIWIKDSDRLQIIEDIEIETNAEDGDNIIITGRTLESLLDRRSIYKSITVNNTLESGIRQMLYENVIEPEDPNRKIPKLRFVGSNDVRVLNLKMNATVFGGDLLETIETYCKKNELGFKIVYNEHLDTLDFSLYFGEDRSYAQNYNPWVVFSAAYDNLVGSNYYESFRNLKTAAIVIGEDNEDYGQEIVHIEPYPKLTGSDRRELYVDGSSIHWDVEEPDEEEIANAVRNSPWANVADRTQKEIADRIEQEIEKAWQEAIEEARQILRAQMEELGREKLSETYITKSFEGDIEAIRQYVYGRDFFIGDVVQVRNQYGKEASSRITEVIRSHDKEGYKLTPTFTTLIGLDNEGDITNPDL